MPEYLVPTVQLFYRHRVIDVADGRTRCRNGKDGLEHGAPDSVKKAA